MGQPIVAVTLVIHGSRTYTSSTLGYIQEIGLRGKVPLICSEVRILKFGLNNDVLSLQLRSDMVS